MTKKANDELSKDSDFKNLVDLMSVYTEAANRLEVMQAAANEQQLELVDGVKTEYAELQEKLAETTAALEVVARRHPEWFEKKATITTPYGQVKLAKNPPALEVANEELSVILIKHEEQQTGGQFKALAFVRSEEHLNLDALKELDDDMLARFKIKRRQSDTFTVKAAKLDLGKAVEHANEKAAA